MMDAPVRAMAVVIPVHNEEGLLGACLDSVRRAIVLAGVTSLVVVVLDRCTDNSDEVAAVYTGVMPLIVVEGDFCSIGRVRDAGVARARRYLSGTPASSIWLANTDADTVVPATWLLQQRALADAGVDLLLGTVEPGPAQPSQDRAQSLWFSEHHLREGHPHVHGANLGIRLSELDRVGGFGNSRVGEDEGVARRVQDSHGRWRAIDTTRVITSSRRDGRAEGGFAAYLRDLDVVTRPGTIDPIDGARISG